MSEIYLTSRALSDRWEGNITVKTLANWRTATSGKGPTFCRYGNKILYPLDAVEAFEQRNRFASTREYDAAKSNEESGAEPGRAHRDRL